METIFKVGDRVFDYNYGWGRVHYVRSLAVQYPVCVEYKETKETYTNDGRRTNSSQPTLSFTEYTLQGFSQERPIDYSDCIGKFGLFWNDNDSEYRMISKLNWFDDGLFQIENGGLYNSFKPLTEEQIKVLEL